MEPVTMQSDQYSCISSSSDASVLLSELTGITGFVERISPQSHAQIQSSCAFTCLYTNECISTRNLYRFTRQPFEFFFFSLLFVCVREKISPGVLQKFYGNKTKSNDTTVYFFLSFFLPTISPRRNRLDAAV